MIRLAITGGLASGKSTVAELLRQRGVPVVDADELAREVRDQMGPQIAAATGLADPTPSAVAAVVFADPEKLAALNRVLHPAIMARARQRLQEWEREGYATAGLEAALVIEAGLQDEFDRVVLVVADEQVRARRFGAHARARMAHQLPDAEKLPHADYVIRNNGSVAELVPQVEAVLEALR